MACGVPPTVILQQSMDGMWCPSYSPPPAEHGWHVVSLLQSSSSRAWMACGVPPTVLLQQSMDGMWCPSYSHPPAEHGWHVVSLLQSSSSRAWMACGVPPTVILQQSMDGIGVLHPMHANHKVGSLWMLILCSQFVDLTPYPHMCYSFHSTRPGMNYSRARTNQRQSLLAQTRPVALE